MVPQRFLCATQLPRKSTVQKSAKIPPIDSFLISHHSIHSFYGKFAIERSRRTLVHSQSPRFFIRGLVRGPNERVESLQQRRTRVGDERETSSMLISFSCGRVWEVCESRFGSSTRFGDRSKNDKPKGPSCW